MSRKLFALAALSAFSGGSVFAASLPLGGYSENFDSMGTAGTTPPSGWSMKTGPSGTSNGTWTTSISASGVAAMINAAAGLTATTTPSGTNNNGFNAALDSLTTADRLIATSPTTVSGAGIELLLTNDTGTAQNSITVSYDTRRYTSVGTANQLPGYWLFYSLNGTTWTNAASLNPTIATVPNSTGVTSVSNATVTLSSAWAPSANLQLRWVDDNAQETSPDQIIGLNNVSIAPVTGGDVPEPAALSLLALAAIPMLRRRAK